MKEKTKEFIVTVIVYAVVFFIGLCILFVVKPSMPICKPGEVLMPMGGMFWCM